MNKKEIENKIIQYKRSIKELEETIQCNKKQLENLEKQLSIKNEDWIPKYGERYFYFSVDGCVGCTRNDGESLDTQRIRFGNCFKTEDEAKDITKKVMVYIRLLKRYKVFDHSTILSKKNVFIASKDNDIDAFLFNSDKDFVIANEFCFYLLEDGISFVRDNDEDLLTFLGVKNEKI